jgi:hypothetical protein
VLDRLTTWDASKGCATGKAVLPDSCTPTYLSKLFTQCISQAHVVVLGRTVASTDESAEIVHVGPLRV